MEITTTQENLNQRIDKFLSSFAKNALKSNLADKKEEVFFNEEISRGEIIRNIKKGNFLVNGKIVKPSYLLKEGDRIEINFVKEEKSLTPNAKIELEVLYQDKDLIVIDKSAGMQIHPDQRGNNDTLVNGLLSEFPEIATVGDVPSVRPGIVHRLDKDTSGVLLVARNQSAFDELKNLFKKRKVEKKYWAIVFGIFDEKKGIIEKALARSSDYRKQVIAGRRTKTKVREAVTEYEVLREFQGFSLVEVTPKTGRMHQIRVHLASIGHPVIGDKVYGRGKSDFLGARRQMLHAKEITFELFGAAHSFSSVPPADFEEILKNLTKEG